jgi:hypothetical protein
MKYPNPPRKSSLESSNPYLPPHKVSNALEHYCIYSGLPKSANSQNVLLRCLGVKDEASWNVIGGKMNFVMRDALGGLPYPPQKLCADDCIACSLNYFSF